MLLNVKCLLSLSKALVPAVVIALAASSALAEVFWTQDFDSFSSGDVHGQGTTWEGTFDADVVISHYYSPSRSLSVHDSGYYYHSADWYDDTPGIPHGGLMEFSWMVDRTSDARWTWEVWGFGGSKVAEIRNDEVGSAGTLDCLTDSGWVETLAIAPADTWSKFTMQLDLGASQDQYRVRIGSGDWFGWYGLGTDEQYLRRIRFQGLHGSFYLDDMQGSVVPEPSTLLLATLGLAFALTLWPRRRNR